jgi:hypothetical protein
MQILKNGVIANNSLMGEYFLVMAPLSVTNQPGHAKSRIFQMKKSNLFT